MSLRPTAKATVTANIKATWRTISDNVLSGYPKPSNSVGNAQMKSQINTNVDRKAAKNIF